jgi:hypothetical protein
MGQFVAHRVQQLRHAKGLMKGLLGPEKFRNIQDILLRA